MCILEYAIPASILAAAEAFEAKAIAADNAPNDDPDYDDFDLDLDILANLSDSNGE